MNLIEKVFGTHSERELKMIRPIVTKIESLRPEMMAMSDEELRDQTRIFRERLADGATLDDVLPEAFATVREAARRFSSGWGDGYYPVYFGYDAKGEVCAVYVRFIDIEASYQEQD